MPRVNNEQMNNIELKKLLNTKQKKIVLKNNLKESWIWKGKNEETNNALEKPLILEFDGEKFYFYSDGIEKKDYRCSYKTFELYNKLDYLRQEQLLEAFIKQANQKDWYNLVLLKMKNDFLDNIADILFKNLDQEDSFSSSQFDDLKAKFGSEYQYLFDEIDKTSGYDKLSINPKNNIIRNLKIKKNQLYKRFEKLFDKFKEKNIDFLFPKLNENYKIEKSQKKQKILQNKPEFKVILLRNLMKTSWIWIGIEEKDEFSKEEPAVLDFNGKNFYFYAKEIEKKDYLYSNNSYQLYNKLDYNHQEKLLETFTKYANQENWYKAILLKMKNDLLDTLVDVLSENLNQKSNISASEFNNFKDKFVSEYQSFYSLVNKKDDSEAINKRFEDYEFSSVVKNLKNKKGKLYEKFETLIEKFNEKNIDFNKLTKEDLKNQELILVRKLSSDNENRFKINYLLMISLKYYKNNFLIWTGINEKNESSLEDPLVLNYKNQDYYFYSREILRQKNHADSKLTNKYRELNYVQQEQLLEGFIKKVNQKDWNKSIVLKMKIDFLDTMANLLSENLDQSISLSVSEFSNLKDKFVSEYENLYSLMDKTKKDIDNNMITYHQKNVFWKNVDQYNIKYFFSVNNQATKLYQKFNQLIKEFNEKIKQKDNYQIELQEFNEKIKQKDNYQIELQEFNENELLNKITESDAYDSLINEMITDDKYQEYLADDNLLFSVENDNNISINVINDLAEFDGPVLKKKKLNNSESENLLSSTELTDLNNIDYSTNNDKIIWDLDNNIIKQLFNNEEKSNCDLDILESDLTANDVDFSMSFEDLLYSKEVLNLPVSTYVDETENNQNSFGFNIQNNLEQSQHEQRIKISVADNQLNYDEFENNEFEL